MDFSLIEMWHAMGVVAKCVVIILAIMSVVTLAIAVDRTIALTRARRRSRDFALAVTDLLARHEFAAARTAAARFEGSHIAPVIGSGLNEFIETQESGAGADYDVREALKEATARTTQRMLATMRRGLAALATIGSTAPFVGLFGTTFGIINSFQGMAKEGGGGLGSIASGIAEALLTTAVGIGVAIVAVLVYNYFTARVDSLEVDANQSAGEVVSLLVRTHATRSEAR